MDNLRAAILLPQLSRLEDNIERWNARYRAVEQGLETVAGVVLPQRPASERYVGSSIQFRLPGISAPAAEAFVAAAKDLGVELKWFGAHEPAAFTSNHHSWHYVEPQTLEKTDQILSSLFDMRLPLTFSIEDCRQIASIIADCVRRAGTAGV
ncbi:DegT/DnrJ/EryC1/StrS family aminotransferase [Hoeflea ulvae]|uniref:DegT/DnrJ/EryC1/StrS family aminotransferase n=1 Tax=Hoeflea ulvae TaxID=2983764 RepID=A0ABT3YAX7_9HYPH|nr:DegT/DnrJ/EryC1/StrS family aminotransferase [Hoeflea ulvae]MCY0092867.1 DegT/DnrJ/EryC1/StrS family aminotransferase [Hoeflea ulvae]